MAAQGLVEAFDPRYFAISPVAICEEPYEPAHRRARWARVARRWSFKVAPERAFFDIFEWNPVLGPLRISPATAFARRRA